MTCDLRQLGATPTHPVDAWQRHMRRGRFAEAWAVSDALLRERAGVACGHLPRHQQWIWDGTPIEGKRVLVRCYRGLGDTIQFVRYAPLLRAAAREVVVWAQPRLIPLLRTARGIDRILPLHDGRPAVAYDVDVEVMELPYVFRTTLATIPAEVPYLHAPAVSRPRGVGLAVGLACESGGWDERRAVPLPFFAPLATVPGVSLHALHRDPAPAAALPWVCDTHDAGSILGTAGLMRALDLVISADSMTAHLAGALGVPVWTLLPRDADWRWLDGRDDSPWYPTMRLFRQARAGDWAAVVARVAAELARYAGRGRPAATLRCAATAAPSPTGALGGRGC